MRRYDDPVEVRKGATRPRAVPVARSALAGARGGRALGGDRGLVGPACRGRARTVRAPELAHASARSETGTAARARGVAVAAARGRTARGPRPTRWIPVRGLRPGVQLVRGQPGASPGHWTEGRTDDHDDHRDFLPAATHSYLERAAESLREAITSHRRTPSATPTPTSPPCGRPRRCWPPGRNRCRRRVGPPEATPGCCSPRWLPSWPEWAASSPPVRRSGRPPSPARGARSASARPTTWSATPTGSSPWWSPRWAWSSTSRSASPEPTRLLACRPLRPPARGLRLLPAVRRLASPRPGRAGRRARDGHPRADRPRRRLRRGPVRQGRLGRRDPPDPRRRPRRRRDRLGDPGQPRPSRPRDRTPVRGGASRDARLPRVTFLARAAAAGRRCAGWSRPPTRGERGDAGVHPRPGRRARRRATATSGSCSARPPSWAGRPRCAATTSPAQVLAPLARPRRSRAACSSRWSPTGCPAPARAAPPHAARMVGLARARDGARLPVVLTNAVRYADRLDAPTTDVLDAARRLVPLDLRHVDRRNAEGFLKSGKQMARGRRRDLPLAGLGQRSDGAPSCSPPPAPSPTSAPRPPRRPRPRRGPLPRARGVRRSGGAVRRRELRARCEAGIGWRYGSAPRQRIWKRLDDELEVIGSSATRRTSSPSPTSST